VAVVSIAIQDAVKELAIYFGMKHTGMDTFGTVIVRTLERAEHPLTADEIWQKSEEWNTRGDFQTTGKTPSATVAAHLYASMKAKGDHSPYAQVSKRPTRFWLKKRGNPPGMTGELQDYATEEYEVAPKGDTLHERDLHPYLATFVDANSHFRAKSKTIFHERSRKQKKGIDHWLHPDMVGVRYPFEELEGVTMEAQRRTNSSSVKFYAFELKLSLSLTDLRSYFFQAVSNASWAHEGYLVTLHIKDELEVIDECRRLTNAFGIGLIQLDIDNVHESQILLPARTSTTVDWDMVNKLAQSNINFREFLETVNTDMTVMRVTNLRAFDRVLDSED
jgi:hypothetical protein